MFYGTIGESSEGENSGVEASVNSTPASVDFPELKKKVGGRINCFSINLLAFYHE